MVFTFLHMLGPNEMLKYGSLTQTDANGRNVLHHAVMNKQAELVERFIYQDTDSNQLRN